MFVCMCLFSIEIQTVGQITMARGGPGGEKFLGDLGCLWSLSHAFWLKLYQTKVAGRPQFRGSRSPFCTLCLDPEGPWSLLEPWSLILRGSC